MQRTNIYARFLRWAGWTINVSVEIPEKCIVCIAPHTSNWDFIVGQCYMRAVRMKFRFLMKKEWFVGPLGAWFRSMGGIPVWRSKQTSMTDHLAEEAQRSTQFRLCITPEGTRSPNAEWKKGFYYIALKAGLPILLYGIDYKRKLIECDRVFTPTGNVEQDMIEIKTHFTRYTAKYPEKFLTGL